MEITQSYAYLTVMNEAKFHLNSIKACRVETSVTEPSVLLPFLSRHLQDRKTFEKLTDSTEEVESKRHRGGRGSLCIEQTEAMMRVKGSVGEEGRVESNGRIFSVLSFLDPIQPSFFPDRRIHEKLYLAWNAVPRPPESKQ